MKIAIYDKWLNSLGGGEKVATVMAEILSKRGHEVCLISNFDFNKELIEEKMGVDLSKVANEIWYERSYEKLTPRTSKYDVFINVSYLDHLPSKAKKSIYYVHFPTPIRSTFLGLIKYEKLLPFLRKFLIIPEVSGGLKPIDDVYTRGGRWLDKENEIVLSNTPNRFKLTLRIYAEQFRTNILKKIKFSSPNSKIKVIDRYVDHHFNVLVYKLEISSKSSSPVIKVITTEDLRTNALALVSLTLRNYRFFFWNLIKRYLPRYEMALYGSSSYKPASGLDTYDLFLANSKFTKKWLRRYWNKESKVLYPPIDINEFKAGKKQDIILNVGRFFVGGHSKKQDILLDAFKKIVDRKILPKGWELHFVGGVAGGKDHSDYLNKLRDAAKGYPVFFHLFASFSQLKKLYGEAKIYWHATGFGENERTDPIKFEHFGITPVEAMAAGCVPIVYDGGGLTETVSDNSGFTFRNEDELIKLTKKIVENNILRKKVSENAVKRSKEFSRSRFAEKLIKLVED